MVIKTSIIWLKNEFYIPPDGLIQIWIVGYGVEFYLQS